MNNYVQLENKFEINIINYYLKYLHWFQSNITLITVIDLFYWKNVNYIIKKLML